MTNLSTETKDMNENTALPQGTINLAPSTSLSLLPGSLSPLRDGLTTKAQILERVKAKALASGKSPQSVIVTRWAEQLTQLAQNQGRLLTDQQYADYAIGRTLAVGDQVRYIGPSRVELTNVGGNLIQVPRPTGQRLVVVSAEPRQLIASPIEPEQVGNDRVYTQIALRPGTQAYFMLERVD